MPLHTLGQLNPAGSLIIFSRFRVDRTLPKYAEEERERAGKKERGGQEQDESMMSSDSDSFVIMGGRKSLNLSKKWWGARLWDWVFLQKPEPEPVTDVFTRIKASAEELAKWDERNTALVEMIKRAETAGQRDLVKKLKAEQGVRQYENALYVKGRRKLLTEAQLLDFTKKCEKGLCLDWVGDFVRPIPAEVVEEKAACDADHLFDNYAVLHYDPENRGTTPEAQEKARDPILFGLIEGSRKLYFVGDWTDEQCDLTFQEIVQKLGSPLEMDP